MLTAEERFTGYRIQFVRLFVSSPARLCVRQPVSSSACLPPFVRLPRWTCLSSIWLFGPFLSSPLPYLSLFDLFHLNISHSLRLSLSQSACQ